MKRWILLICVLLLLPLPCFAAGSAVIDHGNLLTPYEEEILDSRASSIAQTYGIDVVILTLDSLNGKETWETADDHYYAGGYSGNGILLLISMEYRDWEIATYGLVADRISNARTRQLFDKMANDLSADLFYEGFSVYLDAVDETLESYYLTDSTDGSFNFTSDIYEENDALQLLVSLVIGAVVAGIVLSVMRSKMNTAKAQYGASNYLQEGSYHLNTQHDVYLYSNTTRVRRSQNSSSGGGSGGGSRGGSRGKF